jgi:hypothetical protein
VPNYIVGEENLPEAGYITLAEDSHRLSQSLCFSSHDRFS